MNQIITILNFSPRPDGNCRHICDAIRSANRFSNIRSYSVSQIFTPCGNCSYECLAPQKTCPSITPEQRAVYEAITDSDVVYYVVPNFCGMPNAVYYAFNERCVGYFNMDRTLTANYLAVQKRFIIVSNTENNAFAEAMQRQTKDTPEILYMKTSRYGKKSTAGDILDSEQALADLMQFLSAHKA